MNPDTSTTRLRRRAPSPVLERKGFLAAEEGFLDRLKANLKAMNGIFNPLDQRSYDAGPKNRVTRVLDERSTEVKARVKAHAARDLMRVYEEMPKNPTLLLEVTHKDLLGPRSVKAAVAGASFSPSEDLVREGRSARRATAAELTHAKDLIVSRPDSFYFIAAFSATGWEDACRSMLVGGNFLIALLDRHQGAWRTYFAPDARWRGAARLFDLSSEEEKIEAVFAFVRRHTSELLMDELTEDFIFDELGYPIPIIREALEALAEEDPFVRLDTSARPYRLVRTYG